MLALAILALTVGLIRSESAGDLRTLTATGADSSIRRTLTATTAGALALLGALLGVAGAYVVLLATYYDDLGHLSDVPLSYLAVAVVGVPLAAGAAGWLVAGREPPTNRAPIATTITKGWEPGLACARVRARKKVVGVLARRVIRPPESIDVAGGLSTTLSGGWPGCVTLGHGPGGLTRSGQRRGVKRKSSPPRRTTRCPNSCSAHCGQKGSRPPQPSDHHVQRSTIAHLSSASPPHSVQSTKATSDPSPLAAERGTATGDASQTRPARPGRLAERRSGTGRSAWPARHKMTDGSSCLPRSLGQDGSNVRRLKPSAARV